MIPIPPTSSEIRATHSSKPGDQADGSLDGVDDLGEVADGKIVRLSRYDSVSLAKHTGDLVHRGRDLLGR